MSGVVRHQVRVTFGRGGTPRTLDRILDFEVVNDMLELVDTFRLRLPFTSELWDAAHVDTEIEIYLDDSKVLTGFVDDRERSFRAGSLEVTGRCRAGRVVDESAPPIRFDGIGIVQLAEALVGDWFPEVALSNASNRQLIRGRGRRQARVSAEPPISTARGARKKVEPGESRAAVLQQFLEEAGWLAWSAASGEQFIIGRPNYAQAAQWRFFLAGPGGRAEETNVLDGHYRESVGERYSEIKVCGSGAGDAANYASNVTRRGATVRQGPGAHGEGDDFVRPKRLIISDDDIRSAAQALERAEYEMAIRDARGRELDIEAAGFGQPLGGRGLPAIFACDTLAHWTDEEAGISGDYLLTQVRFRESRAGQVSALKLVPRGTELRP